MGRKKSDRAELSSTNGRLKGTIKNKNMHSNFVDLNPNYAVYRHARAVKAANKIVSMVGSDLKAKVKAEARKTFN